MPGIKAGLLLLITFLFVFGWKVTDVLDIISLISVGLIVYVVIRGRFTLRLTRYTMILIGILYFLVLYAAVVTLVAGYGDLTMVLRYTRALITLLGGVALVRLYTWTYGSRFARQILIHLFVALSLHGLLMVIMYFNANVRETVYNITQPLRYVNHNSPFLSGWRITGLTYGLAQTSVVQMWGILLFPVALVLWRNSFKRQLLSLVLLFVVIGSMFISGRTGLVLSLPMLFVSVVVGYPGWASYKSLVRNGVKIGASIAVLLGIMLMIMGSLEQSEQVRYTINKAKEVLVVFSQPSESPTIQALSQMIYVPKGFVEAIFGTSLMDRDKLGIQTDIGYIRVWFANGLIGIVLNVLPFMTGLGASWKIRRHNPYLAGATFGILLSSLILHGKEVALFTRNQWSVQVMLMEAVFISIANRVTERSWVSRASSLSKTSRISSGS